MQPPEDMKVDLISENDLFKWVVTIIGPKDTPYAVSDWKNAISGVSIATPSQHQLTMSSGIGWEIRNSCHASQ